MYTMVVDNTKEEENMKEVGDVKKCIVHKSNNQMATKVVGMKVEEMFLKFTKICFSSLFFSFDFKVFLA